LPCSPLIAQAFKVPVKVAFKHVNTPSLVTLKFSPALKTYDPAVGAAFK